MAPSAPILELILEEMNTTLEALAAGSAYHYSWQSKLFEDYAINVKDSGTTFPLAIIRPLRSVPSLEVLAGSNGLTDTPFQVSVFGLYHEGSGRSAGSATEKCCRMEADIVKGLLTGTGYTRGGYAISTKFIGSEFFPEEFQYIDASVECLFEVLCRRNAADLAAQV